MGVKEKQLKFYLFLIVVVVLLVPYAVRFFGGNSALIGEQPYYHARIAENLLENQLSHQDPLITYNRPTLPNPYHFLLAAAGVSMSLDFASVLIPFLLGLASVFIFYSILKELKVNIMKRFLISLVLVLSPVFVFTFVVSNSHAFAIALTLAGFLLFLRKQKIFLFLSILCFSIVAFFSLFNILLIIFVSLIYSLSYNRKQKWFLLVLFSVLFIYFLFPVDLFYNFSPSVSYGIVRELISDFGGLTGFSVFSIALLFFGFLSLWKEKSKYYPLYIVLILSLPAYHWIGSELNIYFNFIVSVFAGFGFLRLAKIKWQYSLIKNLTVLIIICGLFFSTISYSGRIVNFSPDDSIIESLDWLKSNSERGEVVFSHYSSGHWIERTAGRPVILDSLDAGTGKRQKILEDSDVLFYTRDLKTAKDKLDSYKISYIWINNDMKEQLVWEEEDEGLLFLFRNNETFKNIYHQKGIEIWKIVNQGALK